MISILIMLCWYVRTVSYFIPGLYKWPSPVWNPKSTYSQMTPWFIWWQSARLIAFDYSKISSVWKLEIGLKSGFQWPSNAVLVTRREKENMCTRKASIGSTLEYWQFSHWSSNGFYLERWWTDNSYWTHIRRTNLPKHGSQSVCNRKKEEAGVKSG